MYILHSSQVLVGALTSHPLEVDVQQYALASLSMLVDSNKVRLL